MRHVRALLGIGLMVTSLLGCSANEGSGAGRNAGPGPAAGGSSSSGGSGSGGSGVLFDGGNPSSGGSTGASNCASGAEWIYLLDSDETLLQFRPDTATVNVVGTLSCPAGGSSPFSMSVDRAARAWVLYNNGAIYDVSTLDASCAATAYAPNQQGLSVFGMGFASDGPGSSEETLFVAGGAGVGQGSATLARLDTSSLLVSPIARIDGWPELTGTGAGELWGFAPDTAPPTIRNFQKTTGSALATYQLQGLASADYSAWAFAFWGGSFYIFLDDSGSSTNFWRYDPASDSLSVVVANSGYRIVGAGVSTCAPVEAPR